MPSLLRLQLVGMKPAQDEWVPIFKIHGQLYHHIGSLLPVENETPKFLQIYFIGDYATECDVRSKWNLIDKE